MSEDEAKTPSHEVEEYRALRAEMVQWLSSIDTRSNVGLTGLAAFLSVAAAVKSAELAAVATILSAALWREQSSSLSCVMRLGAYIELMLEPRLRGLRWERTVSALEQMRGRRDLATQFASSLVSVPGVFAFAAGAVTVILAAAYPPADNARWLLLIVLGLIATALLFAAMLDARAIGGHRQLWKDSLATIAAGDGSDPDESRGAGNRTSP